MFLRAERVWLRRCGRVEQMRAALEADMAKQQSWVEEAIASVAGTEQSLHQVRPCPALQILAWPGLCCLLAGACCRLPGGPERGV